MLCWILPCFVALPLKNLQILSVLCVCVCVCVCVFFPFLMFIFCLNFGNQWIVAFWFDCFLFDSLAAKCSTIVNVNLEKHDSAF